MRTGSRPAAGGPGRGTDVVASLSHVSVALGGHKVLGPLSWTITRGQQWVVIGPNGAGKTTLVSLLGGQRQPSAGTADVLGRRFGRADLRELRRHVGLVSHAVADRFDPRMSALDVVLTGISGVLAPWWDTFDTGEVSRARRLLESLGCGEVAEQRLSTCSLGERQRVLIARSLLVEHSLLLLDEPLSGVDLPGREALVSSLASMAAGPDRPTTVLTVHALEELPPSTTHALLLRHGLVVACGPCEEVLVSDQMSLCFELPLEVVRRGGRWSAWAKPSW